MANPRISIIVPVYNVEAYLRQCLDSLLNQTLSDIEIICVDDGSIDGSLAILREYAEKDNRIVVVSKENGGPSSARNVGIQKSRAELIAFVDADDTVSPEAYEKATSVMTDDVDYVCFGIQIHGERSEEEKRADDDYYRIKYSGKVNVSEGVLDATDVSPCNKVFRKSILEQYEISFPEGLRYEDAYFFTIYGLRSKVGYYLKDRFYQYTRNSNSFMVKTFTKKSGVSVDHLFIAIKIYEYLKKNSLLQLHMHYMGKLFFAFLHFSMRYEHTRKGKKKIRQIALNFLQKEGLRFEEYSDLKWQYDCIKNKEQPDRITERHLMGLVVVRKDPHRYKYFFAGIPVMRIKIRDGYKKYYLFSMVCVRKKKLKPVPPPPPPPKLISVIMYAHQAEKSIAKAVRSILNQTYGRHELIIINDASTDATEDIVRTFKDHRIKLVNNDEAMGKAASYEKALTLSHGEFLAVASVEECSLCDRLARQAQYLTTHGEASIVATSTSEHIKEDQATLSEIKTGSLMIRRSLLNRVPDCLDVLLNSKYGSKEREAIDDIKELLVIDN